jgi:hypothetical protein
MKKTLLCISAFIFFSFTTFAQSNKIDIKGTLADSSNAPLSFASVLLLIPEDSSLVTYTLSDDNGQFLFKNIPRKNYLLKATYISYLPHQVLIKPTVTDEFDAGKIILKPISKELYEVVVKTARAPISIKGDTIEYDASKFKVPPGSSVEDLLRKLPGMEVMQDGSLSAQGQTVQKVLVDGKRFFGGDTKMATKNLDANIVKKVQVFDDKSEQSKLTGIDDGKKEKTVNLELKDEAKKGGFGKVTAAAGTDSRVSISANYNKFDSKNQFSLIGFGNNVNRTGMSFDDYRDFQGSSSFRQNNGDFGFSGSDQNRYFSFSDDDDSFSIPVGGQSGDGFSNNAAAGINYNYTHKKTEFSSSYFFNQRNQTLDAFQNRQNFITDNLSNRTTDQSSQLNLSGNHRVSLRGQKELDSLNTVTILANGRYGTRDLSYDSYQEVFKSDGFNSNISDLSNSSERLSYAISSTAIYRHKFKKRGRNLALSGSYDLANNDTDALQKSINSFYTANNTNDFIKSINQINNTASRSDGIKSSILFIEPFAKRFSWETFYNFSLNIGSIDRLVTDKFPGKLEAVNQNLSRVYANDITYNRIGSSIKYSHKAINLATGLARVFYDIKGELVGGLIDASQSSLQKKYESWTPYTSLTLRLKNNKYVDLSYKMGVDAPSTTDLQPIVDNGNPLFIREGNPDLLPAITHTIGGMFNMYNPVNFINLYANLSYSYNVNQIVYSQIIDPELFTTFSRPENISGGERVNSYLYFGFPLKKTKATLNLNANLSFSNNLLYVNEILNKTNSKNYGFGARLSLTPIDWFTFYGSSNWNIGNTVYSINTRENQILNTNYNGEMNIKLPMEFYWSTNLNYRIYKNESFGFDQNIPILGMTAYKLIGEKKRAEIRFSAYDIFNKNQGISQYASQNFVSTREVQTLARYFMISFTYNMRGVSDSIKK